MTPTVLDIQLIKAKLENYVAPTLDLDVKRQAAVALVLRQAKNGVEVLFIQRAVAERDPWSGQIAFPGGGRETSDRDLVDTAVRETGEETAVRIDHKLLAVHLLDQQGSNRGGAIDLLIRCYVFQVPADVVPTPNYEVAEVFWTPLTHLINKENHIIFEPTVTQVPAAGIDLGSGQHGQSRILWGLTYRFIQQFLEVVH